MKPAVFAYHCPDTLAGALDLLAARSGVALAGGQSLVPQLSLRQRRPEVVVDLNKLPGLDHVIVGKDQVRIGAMCRLRELEIHQGLRVALPVLTEATSLVAHRMIRYRATLGGSLCHADPAAELPTVVVALGARLHLRSVRGRRVESAADFFLAPQVTTCGHDELLTEVEFPRQDEFRFAFREVRCRGAGGYPLVGLCLGVVLDSQVVSAARVVAAGMGARPSRLAAAEQAMIGRRLAGDFEDVAQVAASACDPPDDIHGDPRYRRALLAHLLRDTAASLAASGSER